MKKPIHVPVYYNGEEIRVLALPDNGVFVMKYGDSYSRVLKSQVIEKVAGVVYRKAPYLGKIELTDFVERDDRNGRAA